MVPLSRMVHCPKVEWYTVLKLNGTLPWGYRILLEIIKRAIKFCLNDRFIAIGIAKRGFEKIKSYKFCEYAKIIAF